MSYLKINSHMILRAHLYTFNLKYNIYIFICKLNYFLKFGWLLLKPISRFLSLYLPHITCKSVSRGLNEGVPNIIWGRYRTQFLVKWCYASSWTVSIINIIPARYFKVGEILRRVPAGADAYCCNGCLGGLGPVHCRSHRRRLLKSF